MPRDIEAIRQELEEAERLESEKALEKRNSVKPIWRFTIFPVPVDENWDVIYDPTILAYKISGEVVNREECLAVGRGDYELHSGAMRYLFNLGTGRLIGPTGGGTIYLSGRWNTDDGKSIEEAVSAISAFLVANPNGGDISAIMNKFRQRTDDMD